MALKHELPERAQHIFEFNGEKFSFNSENLAAICTPICDIRKISLISVIGDRESGKTFLLNCILNYLESNSKDVWPKCADAVLTKDYGFRQTISNNNSVIKIWPKAYILEEIAVLLIDADIPINDDYSSVSLINLLMRLSSTVIYNSHSTISNQDISILEKSLPTVDSTSTDLFEKLLFVVRDWNPTDTGVGFESGDKYINSLLTAQLRELSNRVECYLMSKSIKNLTAETINLSSLDNRFTTYLRTLISIKLLNTDEMPTKLFSSNNCFKYLSNHFAVSAHNLDIKLYENRKFFRQNNSDDEDCGDNSIADHSYLSIASPKAFENNHNGINETNFGNYFTNAGPERTSVLSSLQIASEFSNIKLDFVEQNSTEDYNHENSDRSFDIILISDSETNSNLFSELGLENEKNLESKFDSNHEYYTSDEDKPEESCGESKSHANAERESNAVIIVDLTDDNEENNSLSHLLTANHIDGSRNGIEEKIMNNPNEFTALPDSESNSSKLIENNFETKSLTANAVNRKTGGDFKFKANSDAKCSEDFTAEIIEKLYKPFRKLSNPGLDTVIKNVELYVPKHSDIGFEKHTDKDADEVRDKQVFGDEVKNVDQIGGKIKIDVKSIVTSPEIYIVKNKAENQAFNRFNLLKEYFVRNNKYTDQLDDENERPDTVIETDADSYPSNSPQKQIENNNNNQTNFGINVMTDGSENTAVVNDTQIRDEFLLINSEADEQNLSRDYNDCNDENSVSSIEILCDSDSESNSDLFSEIIIKNLEVKLESIDVNNTMDEEINGGNNGKDKDRLINNSKRDNDVPEIEKLLTVVLKGYVNEVTQCMKGCSYEDELNDCHENNKALALSRFEEKCPVVDIDFMGPYFNRLKADIDMAYDEIVVKFNDSMKKFYNFYKNTTYMLVNSSYSNFERKFGADQRSQEKDSLKESIIEDVRQRFEKRAKVFEDIEAYIEMKIEKAIDLKIIDKLKDLYLTKMKEFVETKTYFSRDFLNIQHNQIKEEIFTIFCENAKSTEESLIKNFTESINQHMESVYNGLYEQNERNREITVEAIMNNTLRLYEQSVDRELREKFMRDNDFTRLSDQIKCNLMQEFDVICGEENELFNSYRQKVLNKLREKESEYKLVNNRLFNEPNWAVVNACFALYKNKLSAILADIDLCLNHTFEELEKRINVEIMSRFENECIAGDELFVIHFADDLRAKMQSYKSESELIFKTSVSRIQTEIRNEMSIALTTYTQHMRDLLDVTKNKSEFDYKHRNERERAVNTFRQHCNIKEGQYINEEIRKLETEIDKAFKELSERFAQRLDLYIKELFTNSVRDYSKSMEDIVQRDVVFTDAELENLNREQTAVSTELFRNKLKDKIDDIDIYLNSYEKEITIIFDTIMKENTIRRLRAETTLENEMKKFIAIYEESIEEISVYCDSGEDLLVYHENIKESIKRDFTVLNVFYNDYNFEPYITKLELEINKSLRDFNKIFALRMDNQSVKNKILLIEAKKYYKEEMQKYYQHKNYIKQENLQRCHKSVINRTIEKYYPQSEYIEINKFKELIKNSISPIYDSIVKSNTMNVPTQPAIGIDLGTTNSCVAYYQCGRTRGRLAVVSNELGAKTTASVVHFTDRGGVEVGNMAKRDAYADPRNTIFSAKRLIGRRFTDNEVQRDIAFWPFRVVGDENGLPKIAVKINKEEKQFMAEEISAKVLKNLKQNAERHLGFEVKKAMITVPAYFNDAQKEATKDAGKIAGLDVLAIINEPTAAAIAFRLDICEDSDVKKVLIFDFGGGTFDVAVLEIDCGNINIKAVNGDNHLGGDDIDRNVVQYCLQMFSKSNRIEVRKDTPDGQRAIRRLTTLCEEKKWHLSSADNVWIRLDNFYSGRELAVEMSRQKFEELNVKIFTRTMDIVEQVLVDAHLSHADIDDIVLVGGSTRIPKIRELLREMFSGKELNHSIDADLAVAVGAAYHAALLNGSQSLGLRHVNVSDVSPMSLGIRVRDGSMSVIVPRNSKVPNKYTKEYETIADNQREVIIEVLEGEEAIAANNRKLGTFTVSGIPPMPAGEQKVDVSFEINDEGILHVSARLKNADIESSIEIQEHKGRLSDADLIALIEQEANQR